MKQKTLLVGISTGSLLLWFSAQTAWTQEDKDEWLLELDPPLLITNGGLFAANSKPSPYPAVILGKVVQKGTGIKGTLGYGTSGGCGTPGPHYDGKLSGSIKNNKASMLWEIGMGEYRFTGSFDPQKSRYSGSYDCVTSTLNGKSEQHGSFVLRHRPWDDSDFLGRYYEALNKGKQTAYMNYGSGNTAALNQSIADLKEAINWANKISGREKEQKPHLLALAHGNLAYCYAGANDRIQSLANYQKAQEFEEQYLKLRSWANPVTLKLIKDSIKSLSNNDGKLKVYILN